MRHRRIGGIILDGDSEKNLKNVLGNAQSCEVYFFNDTPPFILAHRNDHMRHALMPVSLSLRGGRVYPTKYAVALFA